MVTYGVLDSSIWHKRGDKGPSLAEQMIMRGWFRPSDRSRGSRVSGKNECIEDYKWMSTEEPRLVFLVHVQILYHSFLLYRWIKNPEDIDNQKINEKSFKIWYNVKTKV